MTGKRYYLTTLRAWRSHAARCAETHFVALNVHANETASALAGESFSSGPAARAAGRIASDAGGDATPILALIDADEAAHIALENDAAFEPLPHPLARTPVSARVARALEPFGVASGDDTFTVAEKLARVNPLLRHRVF